MTNKNMRTKIKPEIVGIFLHQLSAAIVNSFQLLITEILVLHIILSVIVPESIFLRVASFLNQKAVVPKTFASTVEEIQH